MISIMSILLIMLVPILATIKVISYAKWATSQGNRTGAWGLYLVAFVTITTPLGVYFYNAYR